MGKNHMKSIAAPKTWNIPRKEMKYIARPNPGAHKLAYGMALSIVMKELTKVARTQREIKHIVSKKDVLVDKKKTRDERHCVGLMDIVEFPQVEEHYRILLDAKGRLTSVRASAKEAKLKLTKIVTKRIIKGKKTMLGTSDGRTIIVPKDTYKTGDSLLIEVPEQKIIEHLPLQKGALALLTGGSNAGTIATIEEINDDMIMLKAKKETFETHKRYAFVIGKDKPALDSIKLLAEKKQE